MTIFHHDFDTPEDYLHHRAPYLLVETIVSIKEDAIITEKQITGQEFFLEGHFPGAPIFPGAMMQELTTQSAGVLIAARHNPMEVYNTHDPHFNKYALGVLVRVKQAKYKGFARPGDHLRVEVKLQEVLSGIFAFSARVTTGNRLIMKNQFQLTNVLSSTLSEKDI